MMNLKRSGTKPCPRWWMKASSWRVYFNWLTIINEFPILCTIKLKFIILLIVCKLEIKTVQ